jgi:hypothetical protein
MWMMSKRWMVETRRGDKQHGAGGRGVNARASQSGLHLYTSLFATWFATRISGGKLLQN